MLFGGFVLFVCLIIWCVLGGVLVGLGLFAWVVWSVAVLDAV